MLNRFSRWGLLLVATLSLGVLLAACGDTTTPTPAPGNNPNQNPQAPTGVNSAMAASFPGTTSFYLTLNTNTDSDQIKGWQNMVKYLSQIPEVKTVFQNADVLALAKLGTYDGDIKPWLGDELAIGLTDVGSVVNLASGSGAAPSEIPVLIGAPVKDQAKAEAFITKLASTLKAAGMPEPKQETYKDAKLWTVNASFFNVVVGLSKDKLFIGGGPTLVKGAFDQTADKSLAGVAAYKQVSSKLMTGNLGYAYLDYQSVVKTLTDNPQLKSTLSSLKSTNLDYTGSVGMTFATADQGFRVDTYQTYIPEKTPQAVADMLKKGVNPNKILTVLPESTIGFANSRDASSSYNLLMSSLKSMNSTSGADVDKGIADFEQQSGLSIQNDVVSLFTGEFAGFVTPAPSVKALPVGFGLVAEETDKVAAQAKLDKIAAAIEKAPQAKVKWENKTIGSTTYRSYSQEMNGSSVSINLGIVGNYVFFTLGDDATTGLITAATGGKNITNGANSDNFNKVKALLPAANTGYVYLDVQSVIKLALGAVPAEAATQVKNYTDKLTALTSIAAAGNQSPTESSATVFIYFPVTKGQ